jgi:hypothetical protein
MSTSSPKTVESMTADSGDESAFDSPHWGTTSYHHDDVAGLAPTKQMNRNYAKVLNKSNRDLLGLGAKTLVQFWKHGDLASYILGIHRDYVPGNVVAEFSMGVHKYGTRTLDEVSEDMGRSKRRVLAAIAFARIFTLGEVEDLCRYQKRCGYIVFTPPRFAKLWQATKYNSELCRHTIDDVCRLNSSLMGQIQHLRQVALRQVKATAGKCDATPCLTPNSNDPTGSLLIRVNDNPPFFERLDRLCDIHFPRRSRGHR